MRHRIKSGRMGSFSPETVKKVYDQKDELEEEGLSEDVENIFEEDTSLSNNDEALAAMEFYDSLDEME